MNRSFIVLSSGRSGSELLVGLLKCHPDLECYWEILNREELLQYRLRGASGRSLTNYILARLLPLKPWFPYIGFKLFNEQLEYCRLPLGDLLDALHNPPVIVLYRENLLETFVSLKIAFKTNVWYSEDKVHHCSIEVDWAEFKEYVDMERRRWRRSMSALQRHRAILVSFEELKEKKQESASRLFAFLGVKSELEVKASTIRQNPLPLERKVVNYQEVLQQAAACGCDITLNLEWLQRSIDTKL